jgi:K+-sensing histidine kinase KdpD
MLDPTHPGGAGAAPESTSHRLIPGGRRLVVEHGLPIAIGLVVVITITAVMAYGDYFVRDHLIFFYLFPITWIAMYYGSTPALVTSFGSAGAAAYLFPPMHSFSITDPLQVVELFIFSMLALIASKASSELMR